MTLVLFLFLGNVRAALITALNIPLALLVAFIGMVVTGTPANLISLGAVDFGIVVDSTVIMMENIFRHLGRTADGTIDRSASSRRRARWARPMAFSTLIIAVAFLPLFTLTGVTGVIFSPMAHTYAFAIGGAILLALTLTPVLASRLFRCHARGAGGQAELVVRLRCAHRLRRGVYDPLIQALQPATSLLRCSAAAAPAGVIVILVPILACVALFPLLGQGVHAQAGGGQLLDPRHASRSRFPRAVLASTSTSHAGQDSSRQHPEVVTRDLAAGPARRRHRRRGLPQPRVLRAR